MFNYKVVLSICDGDENIISTIFIYKFMKVQFHVGDFLDGVEIKRINHLSGVEEPEVILKPCCIASEYGENTIRRIRNLWDK